MTETVLDTAVIGAGAAGLHVGRLLVDRGVSTELFDAHARVGDSWRERYRSLRIFSPNRVSSLPGLPLDVGFFGYPTAPQMGDYLERYARRFAIPVRTDATIIGLTRDDSGRFRLELANGDAVLAQRVIVAAGAHRTPKLPGFAPDLDPGIAQVTSIDYRGPEQLAPGLVLVVGAGNSGTDIALEAAHNGHQVTLSGRHPGQVPVDVDTPVGNILSGVFLSRLRRLTVGTEKGRAAKEAHRGIMLVRNKLADLDRAGIARVARIESVVDGMPATADGTAIDAATVVWATGSRPDFSWIGIDGVLDADGEPVHDRGIARECRDLAFVGLDFQYSAASGALFGMGADAEHVVNVLQGAERPAERSAERSAERPAERSAERPPERADAKIGGGGAF